MITSLTWSKTTEHLWNDCDATQNPQTPFSSYRWQEYWFNTLGKDTFPYVLDINQTHIAPFAKLDDTLFLGGGKEIADYQDIIGLDEGKIRAWAELLPYIHKQGIHSIKLTNIPGSSSTYTYFTSDAPKLIAQISIEKEDTTPLIYLPITWEEYLAALSRKDRHELRRKMRKFELEHPDAHCDFLTQANETIHDLIALMKHDPGKQSFFTRDMEAFFQHIPTIVGDNCIIPVIREQGKIIAAILCFTTPESFLLYNSGFDEMLFSGAGLYLKAKSIAYAIEKKLPIYNFLQGNERYKYDLGGKDEFVYSITIDLSK